MKQQSFEKLIHNLEEITKQYRLLLDCVRREKDALIRTDVEQLNAINVQKEQMLLQVRNLDAQRLVLAAELAQYIGADAQEPRLLELAQKMGGAEGDRLRSIHSALELLSKRLVEINRENATYAESALTTVNSAMENIKESIMGQKTYQKKGKYQQGQDKSGHFVS